MLSQEEIMGNFEKLLEVAKGQQRQINALINSVLKIQTIVNDKLIAELMKELSQEVH